MDFSAWFEVFLGGKWHTFDARHNKPRIGRVLMAVGKCFEIEQSPKGARAKNVQPA